MALLLYGGLLLASLILQSTALSVFQIFPDFVLILVVVMSMFNGRIFGAKYGFVAGLALDLLVGQLIGLNAVTKMTTGFLIGVASERMFKENYVVPFIAVLVASWFDQLLYLTGMVIFGLTISWRISVVQVVLPIGLVNAVLMLFIYVRLYYINQRITYWDELVKRSG